MHPILAQRSRLRLYLAGWLLVAAMLAEMFALAGGLGWAESIALAVPLASVYAFVCLASWYLCRALPLDRTPLATLAVSHLAASLAGGLFWLAVARALAAAWAPIYAGIEERASRQANLLFGMGALLFLLAVAAHYAILAVEATAEAAQREVEARLLAQQAELKALKAQVDPHFLFNSLHSISALTATDPRRAREMCVLLSDFLRASLGLADKQSIRLEEELLMTRHYLAIEQVRFGPRLNLELNIGDEALACLVPPLLLQPLVENAVTHGIANLTENGYVRVEARRDGSRLKVAVENTFDPEAPSARRNGLGVANVRKRLALRHGERASLSVSSDRDRYRVLLEMPAEEASS